MINRDYKNRRDKLLKNLNDNSVAVIFSADEKLRNNDVAYKYRQSSNFFYLSGIDDPSLILIFLKKNKTVSSILICNKPNNECIKYYFISFRSNIKYFFHDINLGE